MKKCPYCAEEIQDEAIVCKHCGRDLKPPALISAPLTPAKPSIWRSGAKGSAILTGLYLVSIIFTAPNDVEMIGSWVVGGPVTFLFWWVVCTGIVWVWQLLFKTRA